MQSVFEINVKSFRF